MAVNTNYQAEVAVKFNDAQLQAQLKNLSGKSASINVSMNNSASQGLSNVNRQLNNLQTDYFDIYLLQALDKRCFKILNDTKAIQFLIQKKKEGGFQP